jgi:hypothetical protein
MLTSRCRVRPRSPGSATPPLPGPQHAPHKWVDSALRLASPSAPPRVFRPATQTKLGPKESNQSVVLSCTTDGHATHASLPTLNEISSEQAPHNRHSPKTDAHGLPAYLPNVSPTAAYAHMILKSHLTPLTSSNRKRTARAAAHYHLGWHNQSPQRRCRRPMQDHQKTSFPRPQRPRQA